MQTYERFVLLYIKYYLPSEEYSTVLWTSLQRARKKRRLRTSARRNSPRLLAAKVHRSRKQRETLGTSLESKNVALCDKDRQNDVLPHFLK